MRIYDFFGDIPELPEEARANPYADFYYVPVNDPDPAICAALAPGAQADGSQYLRPAEYERIFTRDVGMDNGFCIGPEGTGFSAVTVDMPGVTSEMMAWWEDWFRSDDVHYRIWLPGLHISHHPIIENLGWGVVGFNPMGRNNPSDEDYLRYGLAKPPSILEPGLWSHDCSAASVVPVGSDEPTDFITLAHHLVKTDTGFQMRLYAWMGLHIVEGNEHRMIAEGEGVDLERVRLFACHNAYEFSRCAELLPRLFARSQEVGR